MEALEGRIVLEGNPYLFQFPVGDPQTGKGIDPRNGEGPWDWTTQFGNESKLESGTLYGHLANDFNIPGRGDVGKQVHAVADGKVVRAENYNGWGPVVIIEHPTELKWKKKVYSLYAHLDEDFLVQEEDQVKKGQLIGRVGEYDRGGPHLHFEIRWGDEAGFDPSDGYAGTNFDGIYWPLNGKPNPNEQIVWKDPIEHILHNLDEEDPKFLRRPTVDRAEVAPGDFLMVEWDATDNSRVDHVDLYLYRGDGEENADRVELNPDTPPLENAIAIGIRDRNFHFWRIPEFLPDWCPGTYNIKVVAWDATGVNRTRVGQHTIPFRIVPSNDFRTAACGGPFYKDGYEPNDTLQGAADLGTLGRFEEDGLCLHSPGNDDYYRFTAAASGLARVNIAFTNQLGNLNLYLYDGDGREIARSTGAGDSERVTGRLVVGEDYVVRVAGRGDATNPSYALTIDAPGASTTAAPRIVSLAGSPTPAFAGQPLTLVATLEHPDRAAFVQFIRDIDGNGRFSTGDSILGNPPVTGMTSSYVIDPDVLDAGLHRFIARVRTRDGDWGNEVTYQVNLGPGADRTPRITSPLERNPNPVRQGETLTLAAVVDDPDQLVDFVQFAYDDDSSGTYTDGDRVLGNGLPLGGGRYAYSIPITISYAAENHRFLARARYAGNTKWTEERDGLVEVLPPSDEAPHIVSLTPSAPILGSNQPLVLTAEGVGGPNPILEVEFYRDTDGDGILSYDRDLRLGHDSSPDGGWTYRTHTEGLAFQDHLFFARALDGFIPSEAVRTTVRVSPPDVSDPTAALAGPPILVDRPGGTAQGLTVIYSDDHGIDVSDLGDSNLVILGPQGWVVAMARFVGVDEPSDGAPRFARYEFTPPGGTWDASDSGVYQVQMEFTEVSDTSEHYVPFGPFGSFEVAIADSTPPAVSLEGLSGDPALPVLFAAPSISLTGGAMDAESEIVEDRFHYHLSRYDAGVWGGFTDLGPSGASRLIGPLTDGLYAVFLSAENVAGLIGTSPVGYFIVDTSSPAIELIDAAHTPRNTPLTSAIIRFSEQVTGFNIADLSLSREGGPNILGTQPLETIDGGRTWVLDGLVELTSIEGRYSLALEDVGDRVRDASGHMLAGGASVIIDVDFTAPTVRFIPVVPDPRSTAVAAVTLALSEPISDFDLADLTLRKDGGGNLLDPGQHILAPLDDLTWILDGLGDVTAPSGYYTLTLVAAGSGIADAAGNPLAGDVIEAWEVNLPPTVGDVSDQETTEDTPTPAIPLLIGDAETGPADLVVMATSSDQSLVRDADIEIGGIGAARTLVIRPAADRSGSVTITVTVYDGRLVATDTFVLTIFPVNDAPPASADSYDTPEDMPLVIDAPGVLSNDTDAEDDALTAVLVAGPAHGSLQLNQDGSFTYTPTADFSGPDSFTYKANDGSLDGNTTTVSLTVTPVNDAPTITDIGERTTDEDVPTRAITFTVGDAETAAAGLTLSASSTNATLAPIGNIVFGGSGAARTVTITPSADRSGTSVITVTVGDGEATTSSSFTLTVRAVNDAPVLLLPDRVTVEEGGLATLTATATDRDAGQSLRYGLAPGTPAGIAIDPVTGLLTVAPATGPATFAVTVVATDDGSPALSDSRSVTVTVTARPLVTPGLVVVLGGTKRRPAAQRILVSFTGDVDVDRTDLVLAVRKGKKYQRLRYIPNITVVDGRTVAELRLAGKRTFADGRYRLTVLGDEIADLQGRLVDGERDGIAGGTGFDRFRIVRGRRQ